MDPDDILIARLPTTTDRTSHGKTNIVEDVGGLRVGPKIPVERQFNDVPFPRSGIFQCSYQ